MTQPSSPTQPQTTPTRTPTLAPEIAAGLEQLAATGRAAIDALGQHLQHRNKTNDSDLKHLQQTTDAHQDDLQRLQQALNQLTTDYNQGIQQRLTTRAFNTEKAQLDAAIQTLKQQLAANKQQLQQNTTTIQQLQQNLTQTQTRLGVTQTLAVIDNSGLKQRLANNPGLLKNAKFIKLFNQPDVVKLFNQADFIKLFNQADFIKLFNQADFIKLFNQADFIKLFNQADFIKLFNQADFIKLFAQADFTKALAETATLSTIDTARRTNAAQFGHWPKLASTAKPILGYFNTQQKPEATHQRAAITAEFALALDTTSQSQIENAVQQAQINTLIHPDYYGGSIGSLTGKSIYRDFVALGGRLIVRLYDSIPGQFLNGSFGWALDDTKSYHSNERLNGSGLTGTTPSARAHTFCVARSSLPAGAKVFLSLASEADEVAGFYVRYGLGEVMGIGYDWFKGSDAAWDALLRGLIQGTALSYQRRYGRQ